MTRRRSTSPDAAPSLPQICELCLARRSPVDGRVLRGCQWCEARTDTDAWCECAYCEWMEVR